MKKVSVNETCIGCGACMSICPKYFDFSDEGYSEVIKEVVDTEDIDDVVDAAEACPVSAIKVEDEEK